MSHLDPKRPATTSELRSFGLLVGGAFLAIAGLTLWQLRPTPVIGTLARVGGSLTLLGATMPAVLARPYTVWMRFAILLSRVTTPILMGAIYFLVLTPIGALMRAFGRNPLNPSGATASSRWVVRSPDSRRSALERQF